MIGWLRRLLAGFLRRRVGFAVDGVVRPAADDGDAVRVLLG